jgi:hypothetical protein
MVDDPLVNAFVSTAQQDKRLFPAQVKSDTVVKPLALRSEKNDFGPQIPEPLPACLNGPREGLRLDEHSRIAAVRVIIDGPVFIIGKVPEIDKPDRNKTFFPAPFDDAVGKRPLEHRGEKRKNFKDHTLTCLKADKLL